MFTRPGSALLTPSPHCNAPRAGEVGRPRAPGCLDYDDDDYDDYDDYDDDDDDDAPGHQVVLITMMLKL